MFVRNSMKSVAAAGAALAAAGMLLAPGAASAQSYGYGQSSYGQDRYASQSQYGYQDGGHAYDACRPDRGGRQASGAAIGATLGAVAGSQVAARGRRTEGSILGGVLGAIVGASVSGQARECAPSGYDYRYDQGGYGYQNQGYSQGGYGYQSDRYDNRNVGYDRYDDRYDRYDDRSHGYQRADSYGCRLVSVQTRDRYGRVSTRSRQSCPNRY